MAISRGPKVCSELPNSTSERRTAFLKTRPPKMLGHALAGRIRRQIKHGDKTKREAPRSEKTRIVLELHARPGTWAANILKNGKKTPAIFWTKKWSLRPRVCSSDSSDPFSKSQTTFRELGRKAADWQSLVSRLPRRSVLEPDSPYSFRKTAPKQKHGGQELKNSGRRPKNTLPENDFEKRPSTLWPLKWSRFPPWNQKAAAKMVPQVRFKKKRGTKKRPPKWSRSGPWNQKAAGVFSNFQSLFNFLRPCIQSQE